MHDPTYYVQPVDLFVVHHGGGTYASACGHAACSFAAGRAFRGAPARAVKTRVTRAWARRHGCFV